MSRRKIIPEAEDIKSLVEITSNKPLNTLLNWVKKELNSRKGHTLEQQIVILKILQLNNMRYSVTSEQTGVSRKTLYRWWRQHGDILKESEPEYVIAQSVENELASLKSDTYKSLRKSIKKMDELVEKTSTPRHIYAVKEALIAEIEVLKLNNEVNDSDEKEDTFFSDIYKMMMDDGNKG